MEYILAVGAVGPLLVVPGQQAPNLQEGRLSMALAEHPRATDETIAAWTLTRVIMGVAAFVLGVLAGAAIAAWAVPPS
jgi:hypothetical protein